MSERKMPVGYRPRESSTAAVGRSGCGTPASILVVLVVFAGLGFLLFDLGQSLDDLRPTWPSAGTEGSATEGAAGGAVLGEAGADPDGTGSSGGTALHWAAARGQIEHVEALLRAGADPDSLSVASRMLEDATPEERWQKANVGATPLEAAANHGHRDVVERLLRAGAEPRFALHAAAYSGSLELIELFLQRGADPRREGPFGNGPIRHAVMNGHVAAIERLLEAGARPGEQALREAASNGLDDAVRAMADHGVRFDGPPTYWGPLYAAAAAGNASTVELLLELGASTEGYEDLGRPIDVAREKGHGDVVALLEGR